MSLPLKPGLYIPIFILAALETGEIDKHFRFFRFLVPNVGFIQTDVRLNVTRSWGPGG